MRTKTRQLMLAARNVGRGGYRAGAGRPRKKDGERRGHVRRPALPARCPVHVTLRVRESVPPLRRGDCWRVLRACFVAGKDRFGFRLVHFTVQGNHLHLICEAKDKVALGRGMKGLAVRMARGLNRQVGRTGQVFAERYHARILRTPTEVRRALVYVLGNARRHAPERYGRGWIDPCSSAIWFDGWARRPTEPWARPEGAKPVVAAGTWLLEKGWRLGGLLDPDDVPG